ncbi:MFS transporter [Micromonospora narathiwatensis]|uniref:Major Facilitator Superfamily protein n=1 Tax=Micromonospora narathiwatensis TaxID=299146 RepID=A0A1A8ZK39_9ACTN|nr:MFS transporter [Micromonospora narathiwatensis]SBT44430.1 Major Facilitator Superfamily protein [Micromonospora narathiwatensis]
MRRNAGLFVAISLLSGFGSGAMALVAGIWILDLTGSTSLAALAGLCVYTPVLAGPWLGGLLDRAPRRPLVMAVNLGLSAVLLSLLAVRDTDQTWLIFLVSGAYGVSYVLIDAGETALLPSALSPTELGDVNGWRSSAQEGMKLVAPLAGVGLYAWRGGHAVALLSAAMPVLVAVLYAAVRLTHPQPGQPAARQHGMRAGLAVLLAERATRVTVGLAAVSIAMSGFTTAANYEIVATELGLPATFLGVLLSAQGAGSVVGGLVVGRLINRWSPVTMGVAGTALFAVNCLLRCLPWWPGSVVASVIAGVGLPWALVAAVTAVQTYTPAALLGRAAGTANTAMFGPIALAIPLGSAAVHVGDRLTLLAAATICLVAAVGAVHGGRLRAGPDAAAALATGETARPTAPQPPADQGQPPRAAALARTPSSAEPR